jgi:hypothetical protein
MSSRPLSYPSAILRHALLLITAAFILVPFVWMVSLSLKPPGEIFRASFSILPEQWYAWENYSKALTTAPLPRFLLNGVLVCGSIVVLQILICAPAAYALGQAAVQGARRTVQPRSDRPSHPLSSPGAAAVHPRLPDRHPQYLCGADLSIRCLAVRHLPFPPILQDDSRRRGARRTPRWPV